MLLKFRCFLEDDFLNKKTDRNTHLLKEVEEEQILDTIMVPEQHEDVDAQQGVFRATETHSLHRSGSIHFEPNRYLGVIEDARLQEPVCKNQLLIMMQYLI